MRSLKTRSLVFVLSDFQGPDFRKQLTAASRKHDVVGLHLVDPGERALPKAGLIEVRDPETGEHGVLDLAPDGQYDGKPGDKIRFQPSHCCTTVNLHDWLYVVQDGKLVDVWAVAARGCSQ